MPSQGRVVEGYGILQPRISFHLPAAHRSRFTRIWVGSAGVDPYSAAVSDIYQDLFGAGTFTGKGIYDVDAFESATGDTFPDNHILSHDLIEGNFARCGLVTDIELFDDFPVRYHVYARREHRWIRGDWQLLALARSESAGAAPMRAQSSRQRLVRSAAIALPLLERWKILDNLRRSLVPPALVLWLVLSWTVLPLPLGLSSAVALLVLALPLLLQVFGTLFHTVKDRSLGGVRDLARNGWITAAQAVMNGAVLLYQAYLSVDAIVAHAGSAVRDPAASAGVGDGGIGRSPPRYGLEFLLEIHVAGAGSFGRLRRTRVAGAAGSPGCRQAGSFSPGCSRRSSPGGSVRIGMCIENRSARPSGATWASSLARRGASSSRSSARRTTGCRRTISRRSRTIR